MKPTAFGIGLASALALLPAELVLATTFSIVGRPRHTVDIPNLRRRSVDIGAFGNGSEVLDDASDTIYAANLTLGGAEFEVLIDTGSSDLWVVGDVPGTKNLSIESSVAYASGSAQGFINTADLDFDDFTVTDQAYINVITTEDSPGTQGIIGLGPSAESKVLSGIESSNSNSNVNGAPPLDRIFQQNTSTPNFLTVLLSRNSDSDAGGTAPQTGQLSVGSVIPGYEGVTSQPKLPALKDQYNIQHWETLLDPNGIIGPDGNNITTKTSIQNPSQGTENQFHVAFDTGFTFPQMTQDVADAIYGRVPGAKFVTQDSTPGYWRIPCDYELNVTFYFNNVNFPIHPLDLSVPESSNDNTNCMSTFQQISPSTADHKSFGAFDIILGMAFLRNAYLLIDFGDFVDGSNSSVADPYIQLLSITDPANAHTDFVNARLDGHDTTSSQAALVPESEAQHSPAVDDDNDEDNEDFNDEDNDSKPWYESWPLYVIIGGSAAVLAVGAFIMSRCLRTRRSNVRKESAFVPQMGAYSRLEEPSGHARSYSQQAAPLPPYGGYEVPKYQYGGHEV